MKFKRKEKINEEGFVSIKGNAYVSFPGYFLHHVSLRSARQGRRSSGCVRRDGGSHCPGGAVPRGEILPGEDRESQGTCKKGRRDLLGLPHRRGYGTLCGSPPPSQRGRRMPTTTTASRSEASAATTTATSTTSPSEARAAAPTTPTQTTTTATTPSPEG